MANIYTVDQAHRKLCAVSGATNTARTCVASDCMAWVDEVIMKEDSNDIRPNTGIGSVRPANRIPVRTGRGHCGRVI